jgi:hypothetical protein
MSAKKMHPNPSPDQPERGAASLGSVSKHLFSQPLPSEAVVRPPSDAALGSWLLAKRIPPEEPEVIELANDPESAGT